MSITSTIQDEYFPPSTLDLTEVKEAVQEARYYCGYEILDTLGNGMSGKVKRGRCPETGSYVALKIIDKQRTPCSVLSLLKHEVKALRTLKGHPHILPLLRLEDNAVYPRKNGGTRWVGANTRPSLGQVIWLYALGGNSLGREGCGRAGTKFE